MAAGTRGEYWRWDAEPSTSLSEAAYCIHAAWRLEYLSDSMLADLERTLNSVGAPLIGLIRSIRSSTTFE
ncbi:MAG: hypothetical protein ACRD2I_08480 [Vicinamibacterales bacterium]